MGNQGKRIIGIISAALMGVGCGPAQQVAEPTGTGSQKIIGGFDASSPALDAIGAIGIMQVGQFSAFCTGTLIGPTTVLTAKHCVENQGAPGKVIESQPVYFAVGGDARAPRRIVEGLEARVSPIGVGGTLELGSDVGVYYLSESIADVKPLPFAEESLPDSAIGQQFVSIGYGADSNISFGLGTRKGGFGTLKATRGKALEAIFGTFEAFLAAAPDMSVENARSFWDRMIILEGYEVYLGRKSHEAQTCYGDSGGPLLRKKTDGQMEVLGVVSGGIGSQDLICDYGTSYATLGPRVQDMLAEAISHTDPCGAAITTAGTCEGTVATRCSGRAEGPRRVLSFDCAAIGLTCGPGPETVGCVDVVAPSEG